MDILPCVISSDVTSSMPNGNRKSESRTEGENVSRLGRIYDTLVKDVCDCPRDWGDPDNPQLFHAVPEGLLGEFEGAISDALISLARLSYVVECTDSEIPEPLPVGTRAHQFRQHAGALIRILEGVHETLQADLVEADQASHLPPRAVSAPSVCDQVPLLRAALANRMILIPMDPGPNL